MTGTTIPHVTVSITEALDITDVTTGVIGGDGVLDKLLSTMTEHLTAQYEKRRITGVEYATLYLGAYQATLQQALTLTLAKETQAYEIKNLDWEAKLKEAQYNLAVKQLEIATYELTNKTPVEVANLTKQGLSIEAETSLKDVQTSTATYVLANQLPVEVANLTKQGLLITSQTDLANKELETATYNLTNRVPAEVAGITKQNTLLDGQATLQTKEGTLKDLEATLVTAKIAGETANTASTAKQTELYEAKRLTEVAQLNDAGIGSQSMLDNQRMLLQAQTLGIANDAKQKVAKLMLDTWATRSTINDAADPNPTNKLEDDKIGLVVTNLCASVGITV